MRKVSINVNFYLNKIRERFGEPTDYWISKEQIKCWLCGAVDRRVIAVYAEKNLGNGNYEGLKLAVYYCSYCKTFNIIDYEKNLNLVEREDGKAVGLGLR